MKLQTPVPNEGCSPERTEGKVFLGTFENLWAQDAYGPFFTQPLVFIGNYENNSACGNGWPVVWETFSGTFPDGIWALVKYIPLSQGNIYIKLVQRPEDPQFPWKWVVSDAWGTATNTVILQRDLPPAPTAMPSAPCIFPPEGFTTSQEIQNFWWKDLFFTGTNGEAVYESCGNQYLYKVYTRRTDHTYSPHWGLSPYVPEGISAGQYFWVFDPGGEGSCTSQYDTSCVQAFIP